MKLEPYVIPNTKIKSRWINTNVKDKNLKHFREREKKKYIYNHAGIFYKSKDRKY